MRIRTHGVATTLALALTGACASAPSPPTTSTTPNAELGALRAQQAEQTRRIAELEARLALLEADARHVRAESGPGLRTGETTRIGSAEQASRAAPPQDAVREDSDDAEDDGKRPSLRLYGTSNKRAGNASPSETRRGSLPPVPVVSERLPVVPLPEQRAAKAMRAAPGVGSEGDTALYRKGLRSLQERRYDDALAAFAAFTLAHPQHELTPSAQYWRGEAHYAKRDYRAAVQEFEALLERDPGTSRAPDALLKLGLSLRKLGASERAEHALERLRRDFPNSQAAEAAVREGST